MTEDEILIKEGSSNPLFSHTLDEFILSSKQIGVPTYDAFCFQENHGEIEYVVKNVLDDYIRDLRTLSVNITMSKDDLAKYNYQPKLLAADVYGNTDLYYLILKLNGLCNVKEFYNINPLKMLTVNDLNSYLTYILSNEKTNIELYNSSKT